MSDEALARFIDRFTVEYVRVYDHPIERVWRAITDPAELKNWFLETKIDLKRGGAYRFETGDDGFHGIIEAIEPPRMIRFRNAPDSKGYFQYELSETEGGTRMRFVQHFVPGQTFSATQKDAGGDLPGGTDTPWKPGFVGGWHEFWEALRDHLDGVPTGSRLPVTEFSTIVQSWAKEMRYRGVMTPETIAFSIESLRRQERWAELNKVYREHIRMTLPTS